MNVIHIFGASGAGTTTLGKYVAEKLNYHFIDIDDYYWLSTKIPYTIPRNAEERLSLLKNELRKNQLVLSGSLCGWGDDLIPYFTLAIHLETPTEIRIKRLRDRERNQFGERIKPTGDMFENHNNFIEWAKQYDKGDMQIRSKLMHDTWKKKLTCPCLDLNGTMDLEENFMIIINN